MAELLRWEFLTTLIPQAENGLIMRLWCRACTTVHPIPLPHVEKLVYILSSLAVAETNGGFEDQPYCFVEILGEDPEYFYGERVTEDVQHRADADV